MDRFDFIVLGGGLAGLAFAKRMSENGFSVLVLEKEDQVGGLSRTIVDNEFHLDFCAHRFHSNNQELLDEVLSLPGIEMKKYIQKSRILMFGKYLKYPFELQNLFRAMKLSRAFISGMSFLSNMVLRKFKKNNRESYKDWFVYFYGNKLYEVMCEPYTSKIWKTDPGNLSADWANQRFQGENMKKLIKRVIKKILTLDFSDFNLDDENLIPDGGWFYYPQKGIQELPDALAAVAIDNNARIECSVKVASVSKTDKTVTYVRDGKTYTVLYDKIISTIPIHAFYQVLTIKDGSIENALDGLQYMDIIFIYLYLNKDRISNDHWLYFPDKEILFNRAVEFKNWSLEMCPENQTSVCFDVTGFRNGDLFNMPDEYFIERTIADAEKVGYLNKSDVIAAKVMRIDHAYPYYDLEYKDKLNLLVSRLEDEDTYLMGRTGIFRYNNADNSIEMAFELAQKFLNNEKDKSIYNYTIKSISY